MMLRQNLFLFIIQIFIIKKKLSIDARGFDQFRVDLKFNLKKNEETYYKTATTIELLNMESNIIADSTITPFEKKGNTRNLENPSVQVLENKGRGYILYYKGDLIHQSLTPDEGDDNKDENYFGTVADQMDCINSENKFGELQLGRLYMAGQYVSVTDPVTKKTTWYLCLVDIFVDQLGEVTGDSSYRWKVIDGNFHSTSAYLVGDVVIYNNDYYRCIKDMRNGDRAKPTGDYNSETFWKKIDKPTESNKRCDIYVAKDLTGTVANKIDNIYDFPEFSETEGYGKQKFVKYNGDIWNKVLNGYPKSIPGIKDSDDNIYVWQKIQLDWDETSGYIKTDRIRYDSKYFEAKVDVLDGTPPMDALGNLNSKYWVQVKYNTSNKTWTIVN